MYSCQKQETVVATGVRNPYNNKDAVWQCVKYSMIYLNKLFLSM